MFNIPFVGSILLVLVIIAIIRVAGKPIMEKTAEAISDTGKKAACDNEIRSIESKIDKEYEKIGQVVYDGRVEITDKDIIISINNIKKYNDEIDKLSSSGDK